MMDLDIDESNEVSGPESVTVPAGTFQAMKVSTRVNQGGVVMKKTYWYAGGVGLVKSMAEASAVKSTTELLEHGAQ